MTEPNPSMLPRETQQERWIKYGANVALTVVVVLVLAIILIVIGQRTARRFDMTADKQYSLKPQTINIIKDLKAPVKLVSLYTRPETAARDATDYAGAVADLLDEYKRSGKNIDVETIDPVKNPTKVDDLIADVTSKYGGEVKKYRDFCDNAAKFFDPVRKFAGDEIARLNTLKFDRMKEDAVNQSLVAISNTFGATQSRLDKIEKSVTTLRKQKVPDYKAAAEMINSEMSRVSDIAGQLVTDLPRIKESPEATPEVKQYITDSAARYTELKKQAEAVTDEFKKLGDLKLDDLRQKLRERDAILVMGPNDMRSLSFEQVWQPQTDKRAYQNASDVKVKPKFAGEQQVTSAILSLTASKKPKVVFLRPGGPPLTTPGFPPFQRGGPFSRIAERLRDYNFDVIEKDLSGQYAMQAQMQGMPAPPEPGDEEIKDAVWIVLSLPTPQQQQRQMPPPPVGPKVAEHLKNGGTAMCLFLPQSDNFADAFKDWGIEVKTDMLAVHEPVKTSAASSNFIEEAQKVPYIFLINQYGDHLITQPLKSLDTLLLRTVPVVTTQKPGFQSAPLLPVPEIGGKAWGEHDAENALNGDPVIFKADQGDMPAPLFGGAAVQNDKGGRLVVIGSVDFITDQLLNIPDPDMAQRGIPAARFPGNADLFCNSVFWLAHMEPLIAISPSAMDVNRISNISPGALQFWRVGLLLIGLPGAVVLGGLAVYLARRD